MSIRRWLWGRCSSDTTGPRLITTSTSRTTRGSVSLGKARVPEGVEGVARFHELVAGSSTTRLMWWWPPRPTGGCSSPRSSPAGYTVLAVNPMSTSRYRERHSTSGAKSDPGDAKVLAELARTDAHNHRPIAGDSELAEAVKVLARAHQSLIWTRQRQVNQLRSTLREFYPAAWTPSPSWVLATLWPCWRSRRPRRRAPDCRVEDRRRAAPRRPATPHRRTSHRDPSRAAADQLEAPPPGRRRHGRLGAGPRRRHRRPSHPDRPARDRTGRPF
jgi:hypothetical protein